MKEVFGFSQIIWHEVAPKSTPAQRFIEKILNQHLHLDLYGQGLSELFFIHIIVLPTSIIHKNRKRYEKKNKILYISWKVDYEKFVAADHKNSLALLAQTYLDCILMFKKWRVPDFDYKKFYEDVKKLFEENHIL